MKPIFVFARSATPLRILGRSRTIRNEKSSDKKNAEVDAQDATEHVLPHRASLEDRSFSPPASVKPKSSLSNGATISRGGSGGPWTATGSSSGMIAGSVGCGSSIAAGSVESASELGWLDVGNGSRHPEHFLQPDSALRHVIERGVSFLQVDRVLVVELDGLFPSPAVRGRSRSRASLPRTQRTPARPELARLLKRCESPSTPCAWM